MKKIRQFLPNLADLVDALSIDQIKELKFEKTRESYTKEIEKILNDISIILEEKKSPRVTPNLIRLIIIISQINLYIWNTKDEMQKNKNQYDKLLRLAHLLNGIRNQAKNLLLKEFGDTNPSLKRTNIETDDLHFSITLK